MKLYNGDCNEVMEQMCLDGVRVDLTVTSPPYDNLRTYKDSLEWNENIWKQVIENLYKITADGGVVVWVVGDATIKGSETGTSFKQALYFKDVGFNLHDTMIWQKKNPLPNDPRQNRYIQSIEYMFVFSKGKPSNCNYITEPCLMAGVDAGTGTARKQNGEIRIDRKDKRRGKVVKDRKPLNNVWNYSNGGLYKNHPASFPEQLVQDHIVSWSNENDIVFDPFLGSGTTGKMAKLLNRDFIGVEKVKEYFDISVNRIKEA